MCWHALFWELQLSGARLALQTCSKSFTALKSHGIHFGGGPRLQGTVVTSRCFLILRDLADPFVHANTPPLKGAVSEPAGASDGVQA